MEKKELHKLTDEELLLEKKKHHKSKIFNAIAIGFLAGILIYGVFSWIQTPDKKFGFLIPMSIPLFFIYHMLKNPKKHNDLEKELKERGLK